MTGPFWKMLHFPLTNFPENVAIASPEIVQRSCEILSICTSAEPLVDDDDVVFAQELLTEADTLFKTVDADRAKAKAPFFNAGKAIDAEAKPTLNALDTAMTLLKSKLGAYKAKKDAEAALLTAASDDGRTAPLDLTSAPTPKIHTRKDQELDIVDPCLVPDEYFIIDTARLKADLLAGKKVPGARLKTVETVVKGRS